VGKKPQYFDEAEDLYVVDGFTLEAIAARLPVSVTTLSRWKQDGEWEERRRELARGLADLKRDSLKLRQKLAKKALDILEQDKPGPQELYAATSIASRLAQAEGRAAPGDKSEPEIDRPTLFLEDLQFVAAVLKEIDPEGLKVLARNFDLIVSRFKAVQSKNAPTA
jgi:hypothetical protein